MTDGSAPGLGSGLETPRVGGLVSGEGGLGIAVAVGSDYSPGVTGGRARPPGVGCMIPKSFQLSVIVLVRRIFVRRITGERT